MAQIGYEDPWGLIDRFSAVEVFGRPWQPAEQVLFLARRAQALRVLQMVDPQLAAVAASTSIESFGSRFFVIQREATPCLYSVAPEQDSELFLGALRAIMSTELLPDIPPETGMYDRIRQTELGSQWWSARAAYVRGGSILVYSKLLQKPLAFTLAIAHEGTHKRLDTAEVAVSAERRRDMELAALTQELFICDFLAGSSAPYELFGVPLSELIAERERVARSLESWK